MKMYNNMTDEELGSLILQTKEEDPDIMEEGQRYNDAVDICIALELVNLSMQQWLESVKSNKKVSWTDKKTRDFKKKAEVIKPYVKRWKDRGVLREKLMAEYGEE